MVFSPVDRNLAVMDLNGTVNVWDLQSNRITHTYNKLAFARLRSGECSWAVDFNPTGEFLCTLQGKNTVAVYDMRKDNPINTFEYHDRYGSGARIANVFYISRKKVGMHSFGGCNIVFREHDANNSQYDRNPFLFSGNGVQDSFFNHFVQELVCTTKDLAISRIKLRDETK